MIVMVMNHSAFSNVPTSILFFRFLASNCCGGIWLQQKVNKMYIINLGSVRSGITGGGCGDQPNITFEMSKVLTRAWYATTWVVLICYDVFGSSIQEGSNIHSNGVSCFGKWEEEFYVFAICLCCVICIMLRFSECGSTSFGYPKAREIEKGMWTMLI